MRILMVVESFIPVLAGACLRIYGLCSHLVKEGHNVTILTFRYQKTWKKVEDIDGIEVIRFFHGGGLYGCIRRNIAWLLKLTRLLINGHYDIVYVRDLPFIYGVGLLNLFLRVPLVVEIQTTIFDEDLVVQISKLLRKIIRMLLKRANKTVIICPELERYALNWGCAKQNIALIQNGVDLAKFFQRKKDDDIVKKYNLQDKKVLLYLGKFHRWENLPELVEVFAKVKNGINNVKLLLVGDGPDREKIERAIERYDLNMDVIITGFVPFDDVPKYYSVCNIFVLTRPKIQKAELVSPIKPIEAMAMGKVVISTDVGGMRSIIENGKTGFLVEHSSEALAAKIIEVLNDPPLQEEIGANARRYVEEKRDWNVIVDNLVDVYEAAIHKAK